MYEVEMKVRADHDRVRSALVERGASERGSVVQRDSYYNAPTRDFAETDEALRVRREERAGDETVKITYKGPLVGSASKTREEQETGIENGDVMAAILESLGFERVQVVEKDRERFALDGYVVTLDSVSELGEFVEVETEAREGELDTAHKGVARTVESLGLDSSEEIRTSYLELLLEGSDS